MTPPETAAQRAENPLLVERHGRVVTLTLDRPHRRNAMSTEMLSQLAHKLRELTDPGGDAPGALARLGAVDRTVPDGGALAEAQALAASVAAQDPALLEAGVRLLRDSGHLDRTAALGVENGYWWQAALAANRNPA
ncbi:hypothetical protein SMICM17S_09136 [Streptomyces microflavus]